MEEGRLDVGETRRVDDSESPPSAYEHHPPAGTVAISRFSSVHRRDLGGGQLLDRALPRRAPAAGYPARIHYEHRARQPATGVVDIPSSYQGGN